MGAKKERQASKKYNKKQNVEKQAAKAEYRQEIAEWRNVQKGPGRIGHHCPHKEQARTHALDEKRCVAKKHVGYCPFCWNVVSFQYGCAVHKLKGDNLASKRPRNFEELREQHSKQGLLGPSAVKARDMTEISEQTENSVEDDSLVNTNDDVQPIIQIADELGQLDLDKEELDGEDVQDIRPVQLPEADKQQRPRRRRANEA